MDTFTVGRVVIPMDQAVEWVRDYTSPDLGTSKKPFAYPSYDSLDTGSGPNELNDGDLLAPVLLNSAPSVSAFYRLQAMKGHLQRALLDHADEPLAAMDDSAVTAKMKSLFGVLDADRREHGKRGQGGTTLSKVLHRKHPHSVPLHDKWVRLCYVGRDAPVPTAKARSWAEYMRQLTLAMKHDLRQDAGLAKLRNAVQGTTPLTDLRLIDILAWTSKGVNPSP